MELSEILNSLSDGSEKTASVNEEPTSGGLSAAIDRALSSQHLEKTASDAASPSGDLVKMASDLANAEQHALIKEANIYGAAVADGFVARMNSYEGQAQGISKTAGDSGESAEMIKQAMQLGYQQTMNTLQGAVPQQTKVAEHTKLAEHEKVAAFNKGAEDATKVASYLKGNQDARTVVGGIVKLAGHYEELGFRTGNNILAKLVG